MVFWGPWQDGLEVVQTIDMGTNESTWSNGDETLSSEWHAGLKADWGAAESHYEDYERGLGDPPGYDPAISHVAFDKLMATTPVLDSGGGGISIEQPGAVQTVPGPGVWRTTETWVTGGLTARLVFGDGGEPSAGVSGVPPIEEWPAGAVYAELEPVEHPNDLLTLLDAVMMPPVSVAMPWRFIVKSVGYDTWFDGFTPISGLKVKAGFDAFDSPSVSLDAGALNMMVGQDRDLPTPEDALDALDSDWPAVGVIYANDWPGWYGPIGESDSVSDPFWPRARLTFRLPRYRFGYDSVPYRRITNRGDGLAGGARRLGGRTKTIQGSSRRGAGSIV